MTDSAPVLLVDLSSIGHPIWHVSQQEPDPDYTSQRTVATVLKLAADHPHTAICCDAPGPSFRKGVDPTYKANRPQQEAALHHQIDLACEALEADGFPVWRVDGFEGDDLIATAVKALTADLSSLPDRMTAGPHRQRRQGSTRPGERPRRGPQHAHWLTASGRPRSGRS